MKYIIVSYYTKDTPYKAQAMRLATSLERFKQPWHIEEVPNFGSWQKNTHYKATFIKFMKAKFADRAIVFVDADAEFVRYPELFSKLKCDLGLCYRDYAVFPCRSRKHGRELLSGTMFIANNRKTLAFLDHWIEINNITTRWEQLNLEAALGEWHDQLTIKEMPPSYCTIFDWMRKVRDPVIIQHQASRKYKRLVNTEGGF